MARLRTTSLTRAQVEQITREVLGRRYAMPLTSAPDTLLPKLVVNISARHCHLTASTFAQLFGPDQELAPMRYLYQEGEFASEQTVSVVGPRRRVLSAMRILGPFREHDQVELAFTDGISLGIDLPVRRSGDHRDTPGCYLMGPAGMVKLESGVIRAERHVHMSESDAACYGTKHGERMDLHIQGPCPTILENLLVRADPRYKLEVHLDTDEGNACDLEHATHVELTKR